MPPNKKQNEKVQEVISSSSDEAQQIDAIAEIRGWFRPSLDGDSKFYPHVQQYLAREIDLATTVNKITDPIDKAVKANQKKSLNLLNLWYSILHSAKRISFEDEESHSELVALLRALQQHEEPSQTGFLVYMHLRDFYMASRESMNDSPGGGAGYTVPENHAWANLNSFFASVTKDGIRDFWMYCIWVMRDALEDILQDDPEDIPGAAKAVQKYDALVPAAAVWVLRLRKSLFDKEQDLTPKKATEGNPGRGGKLWRGKAEFSKERWTLWKKRFGEIGQVEGIHESTKTIAKEAFDAMSESEKA